MQNFEHISKERKGVRLTVTPTRITLKTPIEFTQAEVEQAKKIALNVAEKMGSITQSWRGELQASSVRLHTDAKGKNRRYQTIRFE